MYKYLGLIVIAMFLFSCGGNSTGDSASATKTEESKAASSDDVIELTINGDDLMKFDKSELRAKAGSTVKITLNHTGTMAKTVMGHNLVILKMGTDVADFANRAMTAKDNDYIPEGDEVLATTGLIGGGESTSVTFEAPAKGEYDFICSFPGHYALMKGKFIVE